MRPFVMAGAVALVVGCSAPDSDAKKAEVIEVISSKNSGYTSGDGRWGRFLSCWASKISEDSLSILNAQFIRKDDSVADVILKKERELGLILPQSYKDFLLAYRLPRTSFELQAPGFLAVEDIGRASEIHPLYVAEAENHEIASDDKEYFRYGLEQDSASGRTENFKDSIVLGRYSDDWFAIVVLYPQNRTEDGEMEAAIFSHAGEFRAPSFAELMRQIYYMEVSSEDQAPPYEQSLLTGTCADELSLKDVWWK